MSSNFLIFLQQLLDPTLVWYVVWRRLLESLLHTLENRFHASAPACSWHKCLKCPCCRLLRFISFVRTRGACISAEAFSIYRVRPKMSYDDNSNFSKVALFFYCKILYDYS